MIGSKIRVLYAGFAMAVKLNMRRHKNAVFSMLLAAVVAVGGTIIYNQYRLLNEPRVIENSVQVVCKHPVETVVVTEYIEMGADESTPLIGTLGAYYYNDGSEFRRTPSYEIMQHPCFIKTRYGFEHLPLLDYELLCRECGWEIKPRYGFTDDDIYILAQVLCGSANISYGEYDFVPYLDPEKPQFTWSQDNEEQMDLVLTVIMNRVRSDKWPDTVYEVVMQQGQFHVMPRNARSTPHELAIEKIGEWCRKYDAWQWEELITPEDHMYFSAIVDGQLGNKSR